MIRYLLLVSRPPFPHLHLYLRGLNESGRSMKESIVFASCAVCTSHKFASVARSKLETDLGNCLCPSIYLPSLLTLLFACFQVSARHYSNMTNQDGVKLTSIATYDALGVVGRLVRTMHPRVPHTSGGPQYLSACTGCCYQ